MPASPFRRVVAAERTPSRAALREHPTRVLRSLAADLCTVAGEGGVTWSIGQGGVAEVLRELSAGAQLLVLGGRGVGGIAGLALGSTASAVLASASCPVIVVPDDSSVTVSERRSVVVGVEGGAGEEGEEEVIDFAVQEAAALGTDLVAVHTWQDTGSEPSCLSAAPGLGRASTRADEERVLSEALAGWQGNGPDLQVREVVLRDTAARGLLAAALTAQLLVVGHRRRNRVALLTSTTQAILHRSACPVAAVPLSGCWQNSP